MRTVRAGSEAEAIKILPTRGLTCKVDVVVYSLKTRVLLDHSAQLSIVCRELLSKMRETQGWAQEQYQTTELEVKQAASWS